MQQLPSALAAMANYKQFVIWQAVPNKKNPNKFDKITVNPQTLFNHNAHDPKIWFDAGSALSIVNNLGGAPFGVGFVFTPNDPFWFFDIDGCVTDSNEWTPEAVAFMNYFQGCAIEVSHSGRGLHIFGTGGGIDPNHGKKNLPLGLEFYTQDRFVALTGTAATGDCTLDCSHLMHEFVPYYFPPKIATTGAQWTTEADPNSKPLKTDKALIKRMCESTTAKSVFSNKASARDLWECNTDRLAAAYPSFNAVDPFDRSSAEQGLCNHLAFWTGKNCERIETLMNESGLLRDKWTDREQYRRDTIINAVAGCQDVYGSQLAAKEAARTEWKPDQLIANDSSITANGGSSMVAYEERPAFFAGHYYMTGNGRVFCPDGVSRSQAEYNSMYSTCEFLEAFGGKPIKEAWKAYVTATDLTRAEVFSAAYRPEYPFSTVFDEGGRRWVNEYVNQDGARIEGDASPFVNHIKIMLPKDRDAEILISWMAALVQYAGKKFLWSPFIQGVEGNGKSLIARILSYCIGADHVEDIDPEDFCNSGGKFNGYIKNHRLGVLEELKTGARNQAEAALKRFIGNNRIQVQNKGVDASTMNVCINFLINSNHKDAIRVTDHTRRFAILFCAQQEIEDLAKYDMQRGGQYFNDLFSWLYDDGGWGKVAHFLDSYQIPDELNPATLADKAPITSSFLEAISESKSAPHQAVAEAMSSGKAGTLNSWLSVQAIRTILQNEYGIKPPSGKMLASYLKQEGYIKHPALTNQGRLTRAIMQEGCNRSVIYVKANSVQATMTDAQQVTDAYMKAQGYTGAPQSMQNKFDNG